MADDSVTMDAQLNINQYRVLTREDELRLFALQTATKDRITFDKSTADETRARILADASAFYAFLTEKGDTDA